PAAPAITALNSASSSAYEVSIRHARLGSFERRSRQRSTPLPSGSRTSRIATSGFRAGTLASADSTVPASPAISMSGSASSRAATPRRTTSWSSTRNTRIMLRAYLACVSGGSDQGPYLAPSQSGNARRRGGNREHRCLLESGELPVRRADLPARQPAAPRAAAARAHQAPAARPLGHRAGDQLLLR